ncbi:MAG: putative photosynthetic complex assembly protein PuhE [Steroidobacteraceae bacterium]|jgi:putative photosynthetic complex assembly protein 2|nr:putative photosynthetic complex assembly protein PuhE [Steroidobacteraceae bacterium]
MTEPVAAVVYALFVWWFTTGLILLLDGRPRHTFRASLAGATLLMLGAAYVLVDTRDDASASGAYLAFTAAVVVWGWIEMTFLMGFVTGPRRHACPAGCSGPAHFLHAIQAILWHELLIIGAATAIVAIAWDAANPVGAWTFLLLWGMRQSAKLNLFLGVPNLGEEYLPDHLRYLRSFFDRRPMNLLFPVSVTLGTLLAALLIGDARAAEPGSFEAISATLLAALTVLAVLEHWFLVLPLPVAALWSWGMRTRAHPSADAPTPPPGAARVPTAG